MTKPVFEFLDEASTEAETARQWYADQSTTAAQGFNDEMDAVLQRIEDAPDRWPRSTFGIRRCRMKRYPYLIFYRPLPGNVIQIVAVAHAHRRPGYWKERITS